MTLFFLLPIDTTHSSTGSEPDPPEYSRLRNILCAWLCVLSRATPSELIYTRYPEPPFTLRSGIDQMSIRLILLIVPSISALDVFLRFNSRVSVWHLLWVICQITDPAKVHFPRSHSLLPYLNLGTRFLVVEEICNIPSLTPQWSPTDRA